jgi:ABC-2 type transport system ATP-binding protein
MIEIRNLCKEYKNGKGIQNISFKIEKNKINCIVGRNGSGKSTTLKCLLGVINKDSGEIIFDNKVPNHKISYLAEERGLYSNCTVYNQIKYFADISKCKNIEEKIFELVEKLELEEYLYSKIKLLSKGNSQKVQLACMLVNDPKLIILDEPFSGMDLINQKVITRVIKEYSKNNYVLISTHQAEFLDEICDNLTILKDGSILYEGDVKNFKKDQKKVFKAKLSKNQQINLTKQKAIVFFETNNIDEIYYGDPKTSDVIKKMIEGE